MSSDPPFPSPSKLISSLLDELSLRRYRPHKLFGGIEIEPLPDLARRVQTLVEASPVSNNLNTLIYVTRLQEAAYEAVGRRPPPALVEPLEAFFVDLIICADLHAPEATFDPTADAHLQAEQRRHLESLAARFTHFDRVTAYLETVFTHFAREILCRQVPNLPNEASPSGDRADLTVPLMDLLKDPAQFITDLYRKDASLLQPANDPVLQSVFELLEAQLEYNLLAASGLSYEQYDANPNRARLPDARNMTTAEMVETYLDVTPIQTLLETPMPFVLPEAARFEHMHVLAGTGHGKTQLLQHLIVSDLQRAPDDIPAMVILDSQGDMIDTIKRLALFDPDRPGSLASRLLIVDPSDVAFPPSLNLFDVQSDRLASYDQRDREQVLAGIIEIYDYIFGGLLGAELTQKQSMVFRFLAQLMLSIRGATIHTLQELLEDATPYASEIEALPPTARGFFEKQFFGPDYKGKEYKATRDQILRRLYGVLQNPSFERMFAQPENRLDLFETLNNGGIVLVNTAKDFLKTEASSIFGRYIIALTLKAAFERATLDRQNRRPTFLWIDEASEYFDDNIDNLLIQARKFNLGLVMAHQYLGQLSRNLPASLMTNTTIKFAGGISDRDARALASEMRTTPEFLNAMTKDEDGTNFAAFVRNHTPRALRVTVPFGTAEALDRMSDQGFDALLSASRSRLSSNPVMQASREIPTSQAPTAASVQNSPNTELPDDPFDEPYE